MSKTILGDSMEKEILEKLDPIIKRYARKVNQTPEIIENSVIYLFEDRHRESEKEWDDYMSANEIGPYAGR